MLVIDSREPPDLKARVLTEIPGSQVEFLHAGDYLLFDQDGHSLAIERKAISDLLKSLAGRKVKRQLDSLRQYDRGILLIEGCWRVAEGSLYLGDRLMGWTPQSVQAILLALQEQTGMKVLHTANFDETLLTLRMLDQRSEKGCFWKGENDGPAQQVA